jgi:hypothetical protein
MPGLRSVQTKQSILGGIREPALEIQSQRLVQLLAMPFREGLQITGAPAMDQDPQHRHQQQELLRIPHPASVAAVGDRLEKADQIGRCGLIS